MKFSDLRVTSFGGGHGLAVTLESLRPLTEHITAVVTVADNGGSSGGLRQEFNYLPPGDIRMALAALCADSEWGKSWAEILQYRFSSEGALNNHAVGNLLLTALWNRDGDYVEGIDRVASLLQLKGRVLPMSTTPLDIAGDFVLPEGEGEVEIRGQVQVATARGTIQSLRLIPENPRLTPEVEEALSNSNWITLGPGSWFSSVMPHIVAQESATAIMNSPAKKIVLFNVHEEKFTSNGVAIGEYAGNSIADHWEFLINHAPEFVIDYAVVDKGSISTLGLPVNEFEKLIAAHGGKLIIAEIADTLQRNRHDSKKLTSLFSSIFSA